MFRWLLTVDRTLCDQVTACHAMCVEASGKAPSAVPQASSSSSSSWSSSAASAPTAHAFYLPGGCSAGGYAFARGAFSAHCTENDMDEVTSNEGMLMERVDHLLRFGDPTKVLGLQVDPLTGIIID